MANDVEIKVKVANLTGPGMAGITASINRLRDNARGATSAVGELRTSLTGVANLNVDLDDRTGAGIAQIHANLEALRAEPAVRLEAEFTGDPTEIAAVAASIRTLRTNAGSANTALTLMAPRALAAAAALEAVRAAARDAGDALRTLRGRAAAVSAAMVDMRANTTAAANSLRTLNTRASSADGRMEALAGRANALTNNMDGLDGSLRRVGAGLAGLRGSVGSLGSSLGGASDGSKKLLMAAIALAPAIVPIAAAVSPLVPALGAAGAAMMAFGAALLPQILAMGKVGEAHKNYKKAVEDSGRTSTQAVEAEKEWLKQVTKASPEVRKAAASLDVMKDAYKGWTDSLASDTLPVATKGFGVLSTLFPKMTPLVRGVSAEFDRLMNKLAVGVNSKAFDAFMVKLAEFSQRTIRSAVDGMTRFGQAMNRGIQSDGFREFLAYVRDSGPIVGETLANLGRALGKLIVAAADTGVGVLAIANAFAKLVNAVPTELLSGLLQMAFAMKALQLVATGLGPAFVAAGAGASSFIRAAQFGGVSSAIQGVTASLTAMQRASIVVGVIAAAAIAINELANKAKGAPPDVDRLVTSLKKLGEAGKFTGELKKTFGDMDGFVAKANNMRNSAETFDRVRPFTSLVPMGSVIEGVAKKLDNLGRGTDSFTALQDQFKGLDQALSQMARSGHAEEAARQFAEFEQRLRTGGHTAEQISETFSQYEAAVASLKAEQELAARSMGLFGEQAIAVQAKLDMQKQSADGLRQSIQALNDINRQALGGMIGFEAAIDAAAKGAAENAGALNMVNGVLDLNGEKARTAAGLLADLADKTDAAAAAARSNGSSWEAVSGIYERGREQLLASAQAMGLTKAEAAALAEQILATPDKTAYLRGDMDDLQAKLDAARARLASVPDSRKAAVRAEISDLEAKVRAAQARLNGLDDRTVYIDTVLRTFRQGEINDMNAGGRAHGGVIGAAGGGPRSRMTLVGEQGPELVDLAPGSRVRSNPDSKRIAAGMAAAGGGGGGPIVVQVMLDGRQVAKAIVDPLTAEISNRGGNVQQVLGRGN